MKKERPETASAKMQQALIELLHYKDFLDINVKELCVLAKVNRTTFYAHYDNLFELLEDTKKSSVAKFLSSFGDSSFQKIMNGTSSDDLLSDKYLIPYLRFMKENKVIYEVYANNTLTMGSEDCLKNIIEHISKPLWEKKGPADETALGYVTRFYISGIDSIVRHWLKTGTKESEEEISSLIVSLSHPKTVKD